MSTQLAAHPLLSAGDPGCGAGRQRHPGLLGLVFGVAGLVGGFAAAWAIWYSVQAKRELVNERRRLFGLEVLRGIATEGGGLLEFEVWRETEGEADDGFLYKIGEDPLRPRKFARRLDLLPTSDMPFWREMFGWKWMDQVVVATGFKERWTAKSEEIL